MTKLYICVMLVPLQVLAHAQASQGLLSPPVIPQNQEVEPGQVEAESFSQGDVAAASMSDLLAGQTMKQVCEWKDHKIEQSILTVTKL